MKFCTNCGAKLNDDDVFCYKCGTRCAPIEASTPKEEEVKKDIPASQDPILEEERKEEEARRLEEERRREEEERLAREREEKERRLADIETDRATMRAEKERLNEEDAILREEENKLREELDLPIEEEEAEEEVTSRREATVVAETDEFNSKPLIMHAVILFGVLVGISLIYWLVGAFTSIHVAIRIVIFFVALGTIVLPLIELIKLVIFMIKNKKFNLFLVIVLGIIQILSWVFVSLNFSAMFY
ncbi:MAG: zinc ribbon domain-containing protein [Bacilli bacterium]|nr:zinc ribbon domain-containing protein [Bacilli bacterium]